MNDIDRIYENIERIDIELVDMNKSMINMFERLKDIEEKNECFCERLDEIMGEVERGKFSHFTSLNAAEAENKVLNEEVRSLKSQIDRLNCINEENDKIIKERIKRRAEIIDDLDRCKKELSKYKGAIEEIMVHIEDGAPKVDASILAEHIDEIVRKHLFGGRNAD